MCGLVGLIKKHSGNGFWKEHAEIFHELLMVDTLRGDDSTGVFMVDGDGDLEMIKEASDGPTFQKQADYATFMSHTLNRGRLAVGHNRKATKGSITDENAHPFVVDDKIIMVHNGSLFGDWKKLAGEGNDVEVDSHAIAHLIHQNGDDVEQAVQQINGAYALIWFNMEEQSLNFLRNSQRPLHFLETPSAWVFASEKNMLDWMVSRHAIQNAKIFELDAGTHCIMTIKNNGPLEIENRKLTLSKPYVATTGPTQSAGPFWGDGEACTLSDQEVREMNRYANGYVAEDEAEQTDLDRLRARLEAPDHSNLTEFEQAALAAVKEGKAKPRFRGVQEARADIQRTRDQEERYVAKERNQIGVIEFTRSGEHLKDGVRYRAIAFDYDYLNGFDKSDGIHLYAWLKDDVRFLVRATIPPEMDEMKVLDLTLEGCEISFVQKGKSWRLMNQDKHTSKAGDGMGIIYAGEVKVVKGVTNAEEVGSGTQ